MTDQPGALVPDFDSIPIELRMVPRWVGWSYSWDGDKWSKMAFQAGGQLAKVNDPSTWAEFDVVRAAFEPRRWDGIGFVLTTDSDLVVEFDRSQQCERVFESYAELSPCETGVYVLTRRRGTVAPRSNGVLPVTGHRIPTSPAKIEFRSEQIDLDDEIIARASAEADGDKFIRLMAGDWTGYATEYQADMALCGILARRVGSDAERIERLFGRSPLSKRDKWVNDPEYRQQTIKQAINGKMPGYLSAAEVSERAMETAREMAVAMPPTPMWRAAFDLAQRLRAISPAGPDQFADAVTEFVRLTACYDESDFQHEFPFVWDRIQGEGALDLALKRAEEAPYVPNPDHPKAVFYGKVASIAWYLWELRERQPFWLSTPKLASILKTKPMTISRSIDMLEKAKILRCVDENYEWKGKKKRAKEYVFTGPPKC